MLFADKLKSAWPKPGQICLFWLGQAGFVIKNSKGELVAVDVYLSDLAEKKDGNKRLMMSIINAEDFTPDLVLATHCHTDHLDLISIPTFLKNGSHLYCSTGSYDMCRQEGLPMDRISAVKAGDKIHFKGFDIKAVFADHGDAEPTAVGFVIVTDGIKIYFTGDTSYQANRMKCAAENDVDILILPINGEYGNMNERDAAMLAAQVHAKLTIPCHFWTFARHQGSPYKFEIEMEHIAPKFSEYTMAQGEMIYYPHKQ